MPILSPHAADERTRIDQLVGPVTPKAPLGTYVVATTDEAASLGRDIEREVFGEVFGNSVELLAAEYDPYEASSVFVLVVDHRRKVTAGVIRILVPSPAGLKSFEDARRLWNCRPDELVRSTGLEPASCVTWDLATLAVRRDYRGAGTRGLVSLALWQAVGVMAHRCGADLLVAIIDRLVYRLLRAKLSGIFSPFDGLGPHPYLASPASMLVWCGVDRWRARIAREDPTMYALIVEGHGLEAAVAPPDWDHAADQARLASVPLG